MHITKGGLLAHPYPVLNRRNAKVISTENGRSLKEPAVTQAQNRWWLI
jgi:hypothetical protein